MPEIYVSTDVETDGLIRQKIEATRAGACYA
jgi:hypothetical protein